MELAEEGTYNWAKAATSTHEILMDPGCPAVFGVSVPKPAWLDDPQLFKEVSAKVLETTATIDHPGAQAMAWRMHGDACVRLFEHCNLLRGELVARGQPLSCSGPTVRGAVWPWRQVEVADSAEFNTQAPRGGEELPQGRSRHGPAGRRADAGPG